jgi:hypothetical protein
VWYIRPTLERPLRCLQDNATCKSTLIMCGKAFHSVQSDFYQFADSPCVPRVYIFWYPSSAHFTARRAGAQTLSLSVVSRRHECSLASCLARRIVVLTCATNTARLFRSAPTALRPIAVASTNVIPLPINGSNTMSFFGQEVGSVSANGTMQTTVGLCHLGLGNRRTKNFACSGRKEQRGWSHS